MPKLKLPIFLNRLNTKGNKRKVLGLGIIIIIGLIGFVGWSFFNDKFSSDKKIYAEVSGHKIYEQEVRDLLGDKNPDISEQEATLVLADKYLIETLAQEQGVTVNDEELTAEYGNSVLKQKDNNKFAYQNKLNELYFTKLAAANRGLYKGKLLVTHFSRNVAYKSPLLKEEKKNNPDLGNPKAIASDKKYAKNLITQLYNDIKSGKISFEEAIKIEKKDPKVGTSSAYRTLTHSGSFDTSTGINGLIETASIHQRISNIKPGELAEPFAVKVSNSIDDDSMTESYFLVIQMDKSSPGGTMQFDKYLEEAKRRLGYEIYV